jgi:hypothetical protein
MNGGISRGALRVRFGRSCRVCHTLPSSAAMLSAGSHNVANRTQRSFMRDACHMMISSFVRALEWNGVQKSGREAVAYRKTSGSE